MEGVPIKILGRGHLNDFIMVNFSLIFRRRRSLNF